MVGCGGMWDRNAVWCLYYVYMVAVWLQCVLCSLWFRIGCIVVVLAVMTIRSSHSHHRVCGVLYVTVVADAI